MPRPLISTPAHPIPSHQFPPQSPSTTSTSILSSPLPSPPIPNPSHQFPCHPLSSHSIPSRPISTPIPPHKNFNPTKSISIQFYLFPSHQFPTHPTPLHTTKHPPHAGGDTTPTHLFLGEADEQPLQQLQHGVADRLVRRFSRRVPDKLEVVVRQPCQPCQKPRDLTRPINFQYQRMRVSNLHSGNRATVKELESLCYLFRCKCSYGIVPVYTTARWELLPCAPRCESIDRQIE